MLVMVLAAVVALALAEAVVAVEPSRRWRRKVLRGFSPAGRG